MTASALEQELLKRVERLEHLIVLAGGGSPPGSSFAGPIVANEAAASAVLGALLPNGEQVFILSHRSIWTSDPNDIRPLTASDAHQRIARNGGGTLNRTPYVDPNWWWEISDIYIDPQNFTGVADDQNRAFFSAPQAGNARLPLRSYKELRRRLGYYQFRTTSDTVNKQVVIHVLSDLNPFDNLDLPEIHLFCAPEVFPVLQGETFTVYINTTLDLVGGFTPQNPTFPAPGGTAPQIKAGATVWAPYIGFQVRFPGSGAVATLLKDLGGGSARISQPVITNKATGVLEPTAFNPANGDAVQVVAQTGISPGSLGVRFGGTNSDTNGLWKIQNIDLAVSGQSTLFTVETLPTATYSLVEFYECRTDRVLLNGDNVVWSGCQIRGGYQAPHGESGGNLWGCGVVPLDNRPHIFISGTSSHAFNRGVLDFDTTMQGACVITMGPTQIGAISIWDAIITGNNPDGHALLVGRSLNQRIPSELALTGGGAVFGSGSPGFGICISAGSRCVCESPPNVTGDLGDGMIGYASDAWYFDRVAGIYNPAVGPIAFSWANFNAAQPAGFGGNAHDPSADAHIVMAAPANFTPSSLAPTGWWRANFPGVPWPPTPSAGTSGAAGDLTVHNGAVVAGTAQNARIPGNFGGAADLLNATLITALVTKPAGTILALVKANVAAAPAANPYDDPAVYHDGNADLCLTFTTLGWGAVAYDGAYKTAYKATATGAYHLVMMRWDGVNLGITVDDTPGEVQTPCGVLTVLVGSGIVGQGNGGGFLNMDLLELMTFNTTLNNADFIRIKTYCNIRYGLSL